MRAVPESCRAAAVPVLQLHHGEFQILARSSSFDSRIYVPFDSGEVTTGPRLPDRPGPGFTLPLSGHEPRRLNADAARREAHGSCQASPLVGLVPTVPANGRAGRANGPWRSTGNQGPEPVGHSDWAPSLRAMRRGLPDGSMVMFTRDQLVRDPHQLEGISPEYSCLKASNTQGVSKPRVRGLTPAEGALTRIVDSAVLRSRSAIDENRANIAALGPVAPLGSSQRRSGRGPGTDMRCSRYRFLPRALSPHRPIQETRSATCTSELRAWDEPRRWRPRVRPRLHNPVPLRRHQDTAQPFDVLGVRQIGGRYPRLPCLIGP